MAQYVVDLTKTPAELISEFFAHENPIDLMGGSAQFVSPFNVVEGEAYNTRTKVTYQPAAPASGDVKAANIFADIEIFTATIQYNRIDLHTLFSDVGCKVNDALTIDPVNYAEIMAEITRVYHLALNADDFEIVEDTIDGQGYMLQAKPNNPAFCGRIQIDTTKALLDRIVLKQLNGFEWISTPAKAA